jgi:hypothetical protein
MATVIRGSDNWDTALKAGSQAFAARIPSTSWYNAAADSVIPFNDVSTGDNFDTGGNFNTSTYKYTAPTTGVYLFWFAIYTANSDTDNAFGFLKNSSELNLTQSPGNALAYAQNADDKMLSFTCVIPLTSGDTMAVRASEASDYYTGVSTWGGCRLS